MFGSTGGTTPMPTRFRFEKFTVHDRELLVVAVELVLQSEAAHRAEIAFDVHAEHLLELFAQVARDQVQRLLEHRAAFDRVDRLAGFEAALELLDQRALAGADRSHQVEHLAALFALQRCGVEIADDLRDGLLDAEELVGEKIVKLYGFIFIKPLGVRVVLLMNVANPGFHQNVVHAGVGELGDAGIFFHFF